MLAADTLAVGLLTRQPFEQLERVQTQADRAKAKHKDESKNNMAKQ
jgi:hypothetical protein